MKKVFLYMIAIVAALLAGIIILATVILLLLGEGTLNKQIRNMINNRSSSFFQGEMQIGELKGKLFREIILEDLLVKESGDTMLYVKDISMQYKLSSIWRKTILLDEVQVRTVRLNLKQDNDSVWNFMKLLPESDNTVVKDDHQSPFAWNIQAIRIHLHDWMVSIAPNDTASALPEKITANAELSVKWKNDEASLKLQQFDLDLVEQDISVDKLSFSAELIDNKLSIQDLQSEFTGGSLYGGILINLNEIIQSSVDIQIPSLELQKFREILQFPDIQANPSMTLRVDNQVINLTIKEGNQVVAAQAWISGLDSLANYTASGSFENIDLSVWTNQQEFDSDLTGTVGFKGRGINVTSNEMDVDFSLLRSRIMNHTFSTKVNMLKEMDRLKGKADLHSEIGQILIQLNAQDIFQKVALNAHMKLRDLDISKILPDSLYQTSINADLDLTASGILDPEKMQMQVQLTSAENRWRNQNAGSIGLSGYYKGGNYGIEEAEILNPWMHLNLVGEGNVRGNHQLEYGLKILDAASLAGLAGIDSLYVKGITTGKVSGNADDLRWNQVITLTGFDFSGLYFDSLYVNSGLRYKQDSITGGLSAALTNLQTEGFTLENLTIHSTADGQNIQSQLDIFVNKDLHSNISFSVVPGTGIKVIFPHIKLNYKDIDWTGYTDTLTYARQSQYFDFPEIRFESGLQSITLSGHLKDSTSAGLDLQIADLNLERLPLDSLISSDISGEVDGYFRLEGQPMNPQFSSQFLVTGFQLDTISFDTIKIRSTYAQDQLALDAIVNGYNQRLLEVIGLVPMHLSLTDSVTLLRNDDRLQVNASANLNNLSHIRNFLPSGMQADGSAGLKVEIGNTIADPDFSGSMRFSKGEFSYPAYGVNYRNINFNGQFDQSHLLIDTVWVESGNGYLFAEGQVGFTGLDSLGINSIDLNLGTNRFTATNGPQAEIVFSSLFNLSGTPNAARFNGNMTIEEGLIHLDAMMAQFGMVTDDPNPPLLTEALQEIQLAEGDTLYLELEDSIFSEVDFLKNLRGEFDINIPGNMWVRGKDINMELTGNIKAIKEGVQTDLFGTLEVRRGHYVVYGKRLEVETGQIELTGGSEINPILNVEVAYSFRDRDKQLRKLTLNVTGRAMQPEINFYLDGTRIEEKDGMAYLVFGRSMEELTQGEQSSVEYNMADLGKSLALGQLSGLVQGALQSSLGLDVVDISGDDSWSTGNVTLGKYLTRNLFLSYSRDFSFDRKNKIAHPDEVILEYQIFKWLYLQAISQGANNGFDLIIQKKWK